MDLKSELLQYGFATVDHQVYVAKCVRGMMESWQRFCGLPLEIKSQFIYTGDAAGTGYEFKNEPGPTKDVKENFHFTIKELSRIAKIAREFGVEAEFVRRACSVLDSIRSPLCKFAGELEKQFGLPGLCAEVYASWPMWTLRLLHYPAGAAVDQVIAAPHPDKLGLTMYLAETTPGVQYYSQLREWRDMPVRIGKTIITPNMQMQYKTRGELKALYHRVVATEESVAYGRYSIVCFADFMETPQYNKQKHGRLQDMPLAFNYDIDPDEFANFFV